MYDLVFEEVKIHVPDIAFIKDIIVEGNKPNFPHYGLTKENFKDSVQFLHKDIYIYYKIKKKKEIIIFDTNPYDSDFDILALD